jgi:dipeptidase E
VKLLLTSGGETNPTIHAALVDMLGRPVEECHALVVPTAQFPHLDAFPENTLEHAERWAADIGGPACAIDEQAAIAVDGGAVRVVSEGRWVQLA